MEIEKKWTQPIHNWGLFWNNLYIMYLKQHPDMKTNFNWIQFSIAQNQDNSFSKNIAALISLQSYSILQDNLQGHANSGKNLHSAVVFVPETLHEVLSSLMRKAKNNCFTFNFLFYEHFVISSDFSKLQGYRYIQKNSRKVFANKLRYFQGGIWRMYATPRRVLGDVSQSWWQTAGFILHFQMWHQSDCGRYTHHPSDRASGPCLRYNSQSQSSIRQYGCQFKWQCDYQ